MINVIMPSLLTISHTYQTLQLWLILLSDKLNYIKIILSDNPVSLRSPVNSLVSSERDCVLHSTPRSGKPLYSHDMFWRTATKTLQKLKSEIEIRNWNCNWNYWLSGNWLGVLWVREAGRWRSCVVCVVLLFPSFTRMSLQSEFLALDCSSHTGRSDTDQAVKQF